MINWFTQDPLTAIITSLKYLAVIVTSLLGVVGLVTEYRDKQTGQVTAKGKRWLRFLVFSGFLSLVLQILQDVSEHREAVKQAAIVKQQFDDFSALINKTDTALNPVKDVRFKLSLNIQSTDPGLNAYVTRVLRYCHSIPGLKPDKEGFAIHSTPAMNHLFGIQGLTIFTKTQNLIVGFYGDSPLVPDKNKEAEAFQLMLQHVFQVAIFQSQEEIKLASSADLYYAVYPNRFLSDYDPRDILYSLISNRGKVTVSVNFPPLEANLMEQSNQGMIKSTLDFPHCFLMLTLDTFVPPAVGTHVTPENLLMSIDGKIYTFDESDQLRKTQPNQYIYWFPAIGEGSAGDAGSAGPPCWSWPLFPCPPAMPFTPFVKK